MIIFSAVGSPENVLEISSRSLNAFGHALSAMNLTLPTPWGAPASVESLYQGSNVFENGGPYHDLYRKSGYEAKRDGRLRSSGRLVAFDLFGVRFPLEPETAFYDMLWITAYLRSHPVEKLTKFNGFSDRLYNPQRSRACQAAAAALLAENPAHFENCARAEEVGAALGLRRL